jgi:hypothetical protein
MTKSPRRLRAIAREIRKAAAAESNPEQQAIMLVLAEGYEKIAALRDPGVSQGEA